jgi:PTH1 family peptidyl-tRNA hydrolase
VLWPFCRLFNKERESEYRNKGSSVTDVQPIHAIIGLGNPGDSYRYTRHNIGFLFLDYLAEKAGSTWKKERRFVAEIASYTLSGHKLILAKPYTFMNESGQSFSKLMKYHRWQPSSALVVHDEINLPLGAMKLSDKAGIGGHNGMASIFRFDGEDALRFRLGIGHKGHSCMDLKDHVLGRFSAADLQHLRTQMKKWADSLQLIVDNGPSSAMNFINRKDNTQ